MKAAILGLALCAFAFPAYCADEPESSTDDVATLIRSLPDNAQVAEWLSWHAKPAEKRGTLDTGIAGKMKDQISKARALLKQMKIGKSIFDYPGLLALGTVKWNAYYREYQLLYIDFEHDQPMGLLGFNCEFSNSGTITMINWVRNYGGD